MKYVFCFGIGLLILVMILVLLGDTLEMGASAAKEQCELTLPRNQHCIMQYVPEDGN